MKRIVFCTGSLGALLFSAALAAEPAPQAKPAQKLHTLRYRFEPGQTLRWDVLQQSVMQATAAASGTSTQQTTESASRSTKVWRVKDVDAQGVATFEHLVENVDMKQTLTSNGRARTARYNSQTDKKPPSGFETMAAAVGPVLSVVRMDSQGKIVSRKRSAVQGAAQGEGQMTIPLPKEAVPEGHAWTFNYEIEAPMPNKTIRKIQVQQKYILRDVKTGVATISVSTNILTPIDHPVLESQLIQTESAGVVKFDVDAGRVIEQQIDADKRVVGFPRGGQRVALPESLSPRNCSRLPRRCRLRPALLRLRRSNRAHYFRHRGGRQNRVNSTRPPNRQ